MLTVVAVAEGEVDVLAGAVGLPSGPQPTHTKHATIRLIATKARAVEALVMPITLRHITCAQRLCQRFLVSRIGRWGAKRVASRASLGDVETGQGARSRSRSPSRS